MLNRSKKHKSVFTKSDSSRYKYNDNPENVDELSTLGMRIRKSVSDGYKTQADKDNIDDSYSSFLNETNMNHDKNINKDIKTDYYNDYSYRNDYIRAHEMNSLNGVNKQQRYLRSLQEATVDFKIPGPKRMNKDDDDVNTRINSFDERILLPTDSSTLPGLTHDAYGSSFNSYFGSSIPISNSKMFRSNHGISTLHPLDLEDISEDDSRIKRPYDDSDEGIDTEEDEPMDSFKDIKDKDIQNSRKVFQLPVRKGGGRKHIQKDVIMNDDDFDDATFLQEQGDINH